MKVSYELGLLRIDHRTGLVQFVPLLILILPLFWWFSVQMAGLRVLGWFFWHTLLTFLTKLNFLVQYSLHWLIRPFIVMGQADVRRLS